MRELFRFLYWLTMLLFFIALALAALLPHSIRDKLDLFIRSKRAW